MALLLKGRPVAETLQQSIRQQLTSFNQQLTLAIILVGHNPASLVYIKHKQKVAADLGIAVVLETLDETVTTHQVINVVQRHNQRTDTTSILVQLPLPDHIDSNAIIEAIHPSKDVDGLTPTNLGHLLINQPTFIPATALGIVTLLKYYQVPLEGQRAVVIGRSRLVGQPIAQLLLQHNATVTIAHRHTQNLSELSRSADLLIVAAGHPGLIQPHMVKPGAVVIDVGLTKTDAGLQGDVNPAVADIASAITPVPGGVGPLTVMCLMQNIIQAANLETKHSYTV